MITSKQVQDACRGPIPIPKVKYLHISRHGLLSRPCEYVHNLTACLHVYLNTKE